MTARARRAADRKRTRKSVPSDDARFAAWKQRAQNEARALFDGNLGDIWAKGDDYDLFASAEAAFRAGQSPAAFIREAFAEDLARLEGEDQEYMESMCQDEGYE